MGRAETKAITTLFLLEVITPFARLTDNVALAELIQTSQLSKVGRPNDKPAKLDRSFQQVNNLLSPYLTLAAATKAQQKTSGALTLSAHKVKIPEPLCARIALHKTWTCVTGTYRNGLIKKTEVVIIRSP